MAIHETNRVETICPSSAAVGAELAPIHFIFAKLAAPVPISWLLIITIIPFPLPLGNGDIVAEIT